MSFLWESQGLGIYYINQWAPIELAELGWPGFTLHYTYLFSSAVGRLHNQFPASRSYHE